MKSTADTLRFFMIAAAMLVASCHAAVGPPKLRVADQLNTVQTVLTAAGELKPPKYQIEWSNFLGGPAVIAAETGGSVDLGWMAETPLVYAQAAGSPVKVVAVAKGLRPGASNIALVVAAHSAIHSVANLRGKKVGFQPGTVTQYLVVRLLGKAGLSLADITPVQTTTLGSASLDRGIVDAYVTAEPMLSQGLHDGKLRVLAYGGEPITPGFAYLVASDQALADPARAALIGEFVTRLARATRWERENVAKAAPVVAQFYKVTPQVAEAILRRTPSGYTPVSPAIIAAHQQEADLFFKLGLIRTRVDSTKLFDRRYDAQIATAETEK
jgi:sulfonate transport system substrate-binding protein